MSETFYCLAHAHLYPEVEATFESMAGGIVAYAGAGSPLTQAFGLGLDGSVSEREMDRIESFFWDRGAAANIELCPLADDSLLQLLARRAYIVTEFSNVLYLGLSGDPGIAKLPAGPRVAMATRDQSKIWAETVSNGFSDGEDVPPVMQEVSATFFHQDKVTHLLVELDGVVAAAGAVAVIDETATIFATGTLPSFRGRGAQSALIRGSLEVAMANRCTLAMATTACGSTSQRNFERQGFQIAFTRSKFFRDA